jgi:serine/threonine protein kinase
MVSRIETMHENKILHRDIKPDNFLIGLGKKVNQLNVIDFGMSKRYVDWTTGEHL